ncbi:hypothetical protein P2318_16520 [Myxococcaceae bacterium GXIMD 01537]
MTQAPADFLFRETMSGPLSLGAIEPVAGAGQGRQTPFTFHATIRIDDLDAFMRDENHAASLEARVTYGPLGEDLPTKSGQFNLFKPGDAPDTRLMTYGMTFEAQGREFHLAGSKTIHDDQGLDLWHDTTRLYCLLHEGPDARGRVAGAGVLKLGVRDVVDIIRSMHSERRDGVDEARALAQFGQFFLGTLWDIYSPLARLANAFTEPRAPEPR